MSKMLNKTKTVDYVAIFNMLNKSIEEYANGEGCSGQEFRQLGYVTAFDDLDRRLLLELGIQYFASVVGGSDIDWKETFNLKPGKPASWYFGMSGSPLAEPLDENFLLGAGAGPKLIAIQTKIIDALKKTVPQNYTNHLSKPDWAKRRGEDWNCGENWKALNRALIETNAIPGDPSQEGAAVDGSAATDKAAKKKPVGPSITFLQIIEAYHEIEENDPAKTAAKRTAMTPPPPPRRERKPQSTDTTEQRPKPRIPGQKPGDPRMKPEIWLKLDNIRKGCPDGYVGLAGYEKILKSATQFAGARFGAATTATHLLHDAQWAKKFVDSIYGKQVAGRPTWQRLLYGALRQLVIAASVGTITYTYSDQDIMGSASIGLGAGFGSVLPGFSMGAVALVWAVEEMVSFGEPSPVEWCTFTSFFLGAAIGGAAAASPEMVGKYFTDVGNLIGQIKKNANSGRAHYLFDSSVRETLKIPEEEYEVLVKLIEEADAKALKTLMEVLDVRNPGFGEFHALRELIDSGAFHVSDIDDILLAAVSKKKIIIELDIIEGKIKYVLNESYTEAIKIKTSTGDAKEIPDEVYDEILEFFNHHLERNETIVKEFLGSREILVADAVTQAKIARKLIDKASDLISTGRGPGRGPLGNKQLEISDLSKTFDEVADEVMSQPHGQRVGEAIEEYHAAMEKLKAAAKAKGYGPAAGGDDYTVLSDQFAAAKKKDVAEAAAEKTGVATTHRNEVLANNRFGIHDLGDLRELFTALDEVAETSIELQKALVTVELLYKSRIGSLHIHLKLIDQMPSRVHDIIIKKRNAAAGLVDVLKESNYVSYEAAAFARLSKKLGPRFDESREAEKALTRWWRKMSADTNIVSSFISTSSKLIPALAFYGISKAPEYIYSKLDANSAEGFSDDFIKAYNDLNEVEHARLIEISWNGIIDQLLIAMNHTRRERTVVPGKEGSIKRIGQVVSDVHQARNIKALLNVLVQEKFHQKGIRNLVAAAIGQKFPGIVELGVEDPWPWRLGMNMMHDIYADPASKLYGTQGLDIGELSKIWKYTGGSATDDTSDNIVFFQCTSNDLAGTRCTDWPGPFTILYRTLFNNRKKIKLAAALSVSQKVQKRGPQQEGRINKGAKTMQKNEIYNLIKEAFSDNMYGQYPYSHNTGEEDQPSEDYQQEWDKFSLEILEDRSREGAIEFAKILIKEFELLTFVLDAVGKDQSLGSEILRKMEEVDIKRIKSA